MEENKAFPAKEELTAGKKRESSKKETKKEEEVSPWEDLRAHPSAFLTTRLNKMMPWPFPMGKAVKEGKSYGGRKGHTFNCEPLSHNSWELATQSDTLTFIKSDHFNKAGPGKAKEEEESEKNIKPKPGGEKKLKEKTEECGREEERRKGSMIAGSEKISSKKRWRQGKQR